MRIRITALVMGAILLVCMFGCTAKQQFQVPVNFYYPISSESFGKSDSYIAAEAREAYGHAEDTAYLIRTYLNGPVSNEFRSPFPAGVTLLSTEQTGNTFKLTLSQEFFSLTGMNLSIACASLAKTCMELTGAEIIQICEENAAPDGHGCITLDASQILLTDQSAASAAEDPTQ